MFLTTTNSLLTHATPSLSLYGITLNQGFRYFRLYPDDGRFTKYLVSAITFEVPLGSKLIEHDDGCKVVTTL